MIENAELTQPLNTFPERSLELIEKLARSGKAITIVEDGKPKAILQDPEEYERLLELTERAEENEAILQGIMAADAGKTRPADEVFDEILKEYGIQG